jgi:AsmA protein
MKRFGVIFGGLTLLLLAAAAVVPSITSETALRAAVASEIEAVTGRTPEIGGATRLSLLPFPAVMVERLSIPGLAGQKALLEAETLEGTMRLPALLLGRIELSSVALRRPRLALTVGRDGRRSWAFSKGLLADAASGRKVDLPLGSIRLLGGSVDYSDERSGRAGSLDLQDAALHWSAYGDAMSASGIVGWRGQTIDVAMTVADPATLLAGGNSEVRGKLACDLFNVTANGTLAGDGHFEGKLAAVMASLRDVLRWAGLGLADGLSLGSFKLRSPATIDARAVSLPAVQLELDGNTAEGALTLKLGGSRPKLIGTLAAEALDLSSYSRELEIVEGPTRAWRNDPIALETLSLTDLDLRISSGETTFGSAKLGRVAAAAVARDGALELSLGEADAYGGTLNGRLTFAAADGVPKVNASLAFEGVDMSRALGDLFAFRRLEGVGRGRIDVAGTGGSVADLVRTLDGDASFTVASGALVGIDLVDVMSRIERRPLSFGYELRSGRTQFDSGAASFAVSGGVARTTDLRLDGRSLSVAMGGSAGIEARSLAMVGEAVLAPTQERKERFRLPFKVVGSWEWPVVEPDPEALIRRSDAAAPLLQHGVRASTGEGPPKTLGPPVSGRTFTP